MLSLLEDTTLACGGSRVLEESPKGRRPMNYGEGDCRLDTVCLGSPGIVGECRGHGCLALRTNSTDCKQWILPPTHVGRMETVTSGHSEAGEERTDHGG